MLARDHALSGALVFTAVAPVLHVTGRPCSPARCSPPGRRPLRTSTSTARRSPGRSGFFTEAVSWVVHKISGGHRKGTHSVLGVAVFTVAAWLAVKHPGA